MKKVITIIGIFGLIFVQAQKVGINQDAPKATLDIKAETANTTEDVEGLLVPRVSKNKAFLMVGNTTTPLKESTLVYIDNTADYTTTPVATSVADITEKGYYFWNGSKWAKTAGKDGAEWVYDPVTKQTNLKRSGTAPFTNKVFYDEKGLYKNYSQEVISFWDWKTRTYFDRNAKDLNSNFVQRNSKDLASYKNAKDLSSHLLYVDDTGAGTESLGMGGFNSSVLIPKGNTSNYHYFAGIRSSVSHHGKGEINYMNGLAGSANVYNEGHLKYQLNGVRAQVAIQGNSTVNHMYGLRSYSDDHGAGKVNILGGTVSTLTFTDIGSSTISSANGIHVYLSGSNNNSSKITYLRGFYYQPRWHTGNNTTVQHEYGIYLDPIVKGSISKYAIYTNEGKVRFGDNVGIGVDVPAEKLEVSGKIKAANVIFTGIPSYNDHDAATNDGNLPNGSLYKLNGTTNSARQIFMKP